MRVGIAIVLLLILSIPVAAQNSENKKKILEEDVQYIENRMKENEDLAASLHLQGGLDTESIFSDIEGGFNESYFRIISTPFEDFIKKSIAAEPSKEVQEANEKSGFYGHPLIYFKHHLNWVKDPNYELKVNWPALIADFDKWKTNDKKIGELLVQYGELSKKWRTWTDDEGKQLEVIRQQIIQLASFRGRYGLEIKLQCPEPFVETASEDKFEMQPVIMIRSTVRPATDLSADSLYPDEPFYARVTMSEEQANKYGKAIVLRFESSKNKSWLILERIGKFPVFENQQEATLTGGLYYYDEASEISPIRLVSTPLRFDDAETIIVRLVKQPESKIEFPIYITKLKQAVFRLTTVLDHESVIFLTIAGDKSIPDSDRTVARSKLRMISNARRILSISDDEYRNFAVAEKTLEYLHDMDFWKNPLKPMLPDGKLVDDPRFPGVSYFSQVEKDTIDRAIEEGSFKRLDAIWSAAVGVSNDIALFGISLTGADSFVAFCFGISPTGERVDTTERVLAGISLGSQMLLSGSLMAREYQSGGPFRPGRVSRFLKTSKGSALGVEKGVLSSHGPAGSRTGPLKVTSLVAGRTQILGAEIDLEKAVNSVHEDLVIPGSRLRNKGGYLLQWFDDNCGPTVFEKMRRKVGLAKRSDGENMILLYQQSNRAYRAGVGMATDGFARGLVREGFEVRTPKAVTLGDIKQQLSKGRQVALMINTAAPGRKPFYHWVQIEDVQQFPNGKGLVAYGDPWTGSVWEVDSCVFWKQMNRDEVVYAKWTNKPPPAVLPLKKGTALPKPPVGAGKGSDLGKLIEDYSKQHGEQIPRIHTTNKDTLEKIKSAGRLERPPGAGAQFSPPGIGLLRDGDIAIRVKPDSTTVEFVKSTEGFGDSVKYWPEGIGKGKFKSYIPTYELQYFDAEKQTWVDLALRPKK